MELYDSWKTGETHAIDDRFENSIFQLNIWKASERGKRLSSRQQSNTAGENNPITLENIRMPLMRSIGRLWQWA